jgi:hypothetical protein
MPGAAAMASSSDRARGSQTDEPNCSFCLHLDVRHRVKMGWYVFLRSGFAFSANEPAVFKARKDLMNSFGKWL